MEFINIWQLLNPQGEYKRRQRACEHLWQSYSAEKQQRIYDAISKAMANGEEVNINPYFAIEDAALALPRRRVLTFDEYYARYGTTEEQNGWRRVFLPDQQKTIYVKSN